MRTTLTAFAVWLSLAAPAPVAATGEWRGVARAAGRPLADAVIWLEASSELTSRTQPPPLLDQRNLQFLPRVLAVRVGTTVKFPNSDRVFHNVFSFRDGKKFDLGMYPKGTSKRIVFDKPGLARVFCNIHPNMAAYVLAVESPYFAVSNDQGAFSIAGVPTGTYTYHAWRPGGGQPLTGSVTVDGTQPIEIHW